MPRMNILNTVEQEAFDSAPVFNSSQRKHYFDFPQAIQQAAASLRTPANQLCFLLSGGYFKASIADREAFLDAVAHGSAAAWRHFNLLGEYDFSEEKLRDSVGIRLPKLTP